MVYNLHKEVKEMEKESNGIGIFGTLTLIFVVLKLVGVISWSWWWVLSPSLIAIGSWLVVWFVIGVVIGVKENKK